jgi:hypothetical protein
MKFRSGYYGVINGKEYSISSSEKGWKIYKFDIPRTKPILFIDKKDAKEKITSAYVVRTKSKYKGFEFTLFQNEVLQKDKKIRL